MMKYCTRGKRERKTKKSNQIKDTKENKRREKKL